jgi:hypothetical protein
MASKEKNQKNRQDFSAKEELIRRFKARPFIFAGTIVILIIVIIAFILVPAIVPNADRGADLNFGSYNKTPIVFVPGNYFSQVRENLAAQYAIDENNYATVNYQVWRGAFEQTVARIGALQEMKAAGYTPPDAMVDRAVAQLPRFQDNGRFSSALYKRLDNSSRLALWREERDSIIERRYRSDIAGLRIPSGETAFIGSMASPERSFDMAAFSLSAYPDSEVRAYVGANPDLFKITHLSMITIKSSEREARQILDSIRDGTATFEDAARTQSQDSYADSGGDTGVKMAYELANTVPDAGEREQVLALARGDYSPIVKVPDGWGFFRCEETPYPADVNDAAALEKIRGYLTEFERGRIDDWLIGQAEELIAAAKENGFDSAAADKGLVKQSFGPLPVNYGGSALFSQSYNYNLFPALGTFSIQELTGADVNDNFWRAAFFTPVNTPSNPVVVGSYIIVLYPREERPAEEAAVSTIENTYSSYWLSYFTEQIIGSYFTSSKKLDDKFLNVFFRYLWSPN